MLNYTHTQISRWVGGGVVERRPRWMPINCQLGSIIPSSANYHTMTWKFVKPQWMWMWMRPWSPSPIPIPSRSRSRKKKALSCFICHISLAWRVTTHSQHFICVLNLYCNLNQRRLAAMLENTHTFIYSYTHTLIHSFPGWPTNASVALVANKKRTHVVCAIFASCPPSGIR